MTAQETKQLKIGLALALLASLMFSLKPIFIKQAYELGASSEGLMVLRMWLALPFYLGMLFFQRHNFGLIRQHSLSILALGFLGYFLSSYLDLLALNFISAQAERIILYAYPSLVVLMMAMYEKRLPGLRVIIAMALVYLGLIVLLPGELNLSGSYFGLGLMLMCAFTFALYVCISKPMISLLGASAFTSAAMVSSILFTQLHFVTIDVEEIIDYQNSIYVLALALAFFSTVIPSYAMSAAISRIGAEKTAITGSTGPVFTLILAAVILGESITLFHATGLCLVIFGVWLLGKKS